MPTDSPTPQDPALERVAREALSAAVRANDAAEVALVIEQYPILKSKLDEPMLPDDAFGATPLLGAVHRRNTQMIDVLLRAGADINARSHWWAGGFGVLDGEPELAPFLIARGAVVDVHAAARLGMSDRLRELLSEDPGLVHARGGDGQTPLHVALSVEIASDLLEHGADIDARDIDHESTPAQYMVRDRQDVARFLVGRGCRTDILMVSALGDLERVRRHLDADPDCVGTTASNEHFPTVNPRSGGSIYFWTLGRDKTAHAVAREFGHQDVFELLMSRSPEALQLTVACETGDRERAASLRRARPDLVQTMDERYRRRIAAAARHDNTAGVVLMLEAGWPADVRGDHGATLLHWAAWHGNREMVEALVGRGAPLEAVDRDFVATPVQWALHGSVHGERASTGEYAATVDTLLRAGARAPKIDGASQVSDAVREILRRYV